MTQLGGRQWTQLWTVVSSALASAIPAEEHLAVEAVVAYVDGELSVAAHERATRHLAACTLCTAEVAAQRQARAAVRGATAPAMPASLLAALHAIPHSVDLSSGPDGLDQLDGLAMGEDGQFVVPQRPLGGVAPMALTPRGMAPLGLTAPLGSGDRLGSAALTTPAGRTARRVVQGAGVVVSGLVLGALALTAPGAAPDEPTGPGSPGPAAETGGSPVSGAPARFEFEPRTDESERDEAVTVSGLPQR